MDAKFRRGGSEISFGLTKVRGQCNEISWRALGDFSLEQRTNLANCALIFLHSTVSVPFSLPPCRRRQYCRFYSLVAEYSLYVYLVTGRGTFQLLILMPLRIIPRYRIVHSLTHPRSLILVTDRVQTLILRVWSRSLQWPLKWRLMSSAFVWCWEAVKWNFSVFVFTVLTKVSLSLPQRKGLQYRKIHYTKSELHVKCHRKLMSQSLARYLYDVGPLTGKKMNCKKTWYRIFRSFTIALFDFVSDYFSWERKCIWLRGKTIVIFNLIFLCPCFVALIYVLRISWSERIILITEPGFKKWISAKESWMSDFNK